MMKKRKSIYFLSDAVELASCKSLLTALWNFLYFPDLCSSLNTREAATSWLVPKTGWYAWSRRDILTGRDCLLGETESLWFRRPLQTRHTAGAILCDVPYWYVSVNVKQRQLIVDNRFARRRINGHFSLEILETSQVLINFRFLSSGCFRVLWRAHCSDTSDTMEYERWFLNPLGTTGTVGLPHTSKGLKDPSFDESSSAAGLVGTLIILLTIAGSCSIMGCLSFRHRRYKSALWRTLYSRSDTWARYHDQRAATDALSLLHVKSARERLKETTQINMTRMNT